MHKIQGWTGLRAAVIALGLVAWTATGATAATLTSSASGLSYTTSVQVDPTTGVSGTNVISFVPASTSSVDLSTGQTNVGLGNFVISPLPAGQSTTYTNTPIQFSFLPASYGSDTSVSNDPSIVVKGVLNGTETGPSSSTVTATFNSVTSGTSGTSVPDGLISLGTNGGSAAFSLPSTTLLLAPSTSNGGTTSVQGLITRDEAPVPEPSTIALFLTTVGGLGLRRYVLSRRRAASA